MTNAEVIALGKENYMKNYSQFPLAIKGGKGMYLFDEDGKSYLDFVAGIAVNALGYGDEDEKKALLEVMDSGVLHTSNLYYNSKAVQAAKLINEGVMNMSIWTDIVSGAAVVTAIWRLFPIFTNRSGTRTMAGRENPGRRSTAMTAGTSTSGKNVPHSGMIWKSGSSTFTARWSRRKFPGSCRSWS